MDSKEVQSQLSPVRPGVGHSYSTSDPCLLIFKSVLEENYSALARGVVSIIFDVMCDAATPFVCRASSKGTA
eukprot:1157690-Pelagomonas_calceolata.AAC.8